MDQAFLTALLGAFAAGALAKTKDVASDAVKTAYEELKAALMHRLGSGGAVQSLEERPQSKAAQEVLAEVLAEKQLQADAELQAQVQQLEKALTTAKTADGTGDIEIDRVQAHVNAAVDDLVASGRIKLGSIVAETGDVRVSGFRAGTEKN